MDDTDAKVVNALKNAVADGDLKLAVKHLSNLACFYQGCSIDDRRKRQIRDTLEKLKRAVLGLAIKEGSTELIDLLTVPRLFDYENVHLHLRKARREDDVEKGKQDASSNRTNRKANVSKGGPSDGYDAECLPADGVLARTQTIPIINAQINHQAIEINTQSDWLDILNRSKNG